MGGGGASQGQCIPGLSLCLVADAVLAPCGGHLLVMRQAGPSTSSSHFLFSHH